MSVREEQQNYTQIMREYTEGKGLKYNIVTYGCQMNVHDSEKLAGMLLEMGYEEAQTLEEADVILFNTCCVRQNAEQRVYGNVGALRSYKRANPNLIIGVCGCMMQQKEVAGDIIKKFPFVDLVFGTHNLHHFPRLLYEAINSGHTIVEVLDEEGRIVEGIPARRTSKVSAYVTIMYGCNNFCTYCIVPYVRGRERSRASRDILDEIRELADKGCKEVTLLGQNVNSYGKDLGNGYLFPDLLRDVNRIENIERIRFVTSHPKDLSPDLIDAMTECEKVCEHIHLPLQAGSNEILRKMNRQYTREDYLKLVDRLRQRIPDIAISTDLIVGFPGETEEDFQDTLDMVEKIQYDSAFTFIYSPRRGTPAARMQEQLDEDVKKERLNRLIELQNDISKSKNQQYMGKVVEVLVEGISKNNPKMLSSRTRTNKLVHFEGGSEIIGEFVKVKITEPKAWTLEGYMI
ncbi:MAG: tRNA (N6-isopentenyl adenosine(37)-C2)-methylthiotransferase MiaB [Clostridiales bacterium]|mgnify:CR=1 FL=1|nr:tRNA (N6-isopentenyl adenosine(37)-C2)-methylthiotransferase MiaB [Clostridiales bacterium]